MRKLFDLSFRSKIPLWGGLLMVLTALAISAALLFRVYDDMMQDMRTSSDHLGRVLALGGSNCVVWFNFLKKTENRPLY